MRQSFYDDEEEDYLPPIGDNTMRSARAGAPGSYGVVAPAIIRPNQPRPSADLSGTEDVGLRDVPATPRPSTLDLLKQQYEAKPQHPEPKLWQRIASAAAGGLAGYVNAGGRTHVDPTAGQAFLHLHPGYDKQAESWQSRLDALKNTLGAEETAEKISANAEERRQKAGSYAANAQLHKKQLESLDASRKQAEQDRELKLTTEPGVEELQSPEPLDQADIHGTHFELNGKRYGRIRPEELERRKLEADRTTWEPLPDAIADTLKIKRGTKVKDLASYAKLYEETQKTKNPTAASLAWEASGHDPVKAVQLMKERPPVINIGEQRKSAAEEAEDRVLDAFGGDWGKVGEAGYAKVKELAGKHAPSVWSKVSKAQNDAAKATKLPADAQKRIVSANATIDQGQRALATIEAVEKQHPNYTGQVVGRLVSGARTATGSEPPEIGAADAALESLLALQPGQHGFRSASAMDNFKKATGVDLRTGRSDGTRAWLRNPAKAKAAIREIIRFNSTLRDEALSKNKAQSLSEQQPSGATSVDHDYVNSLGIK